MIKSIETHLRYSILSLGLTLTALKVFYFDLLNWVNILTFLPLVVILALIWLAFLYTGFFSISQCFRQGNRQLGVLSSLLWIGFSVALLLLNSTKADFYQNQNDLNKISATLESKLQEGEYIAYSPYQPTLRVIPISKAASNSYPRILTLLELPRTHRFKNIFASQYKNRTLVSISRYCWGIIFSCVEGRYVYLSNPQTQPYQKVDICPKDPEHCINLRFVNANKTDEMLTDRWSWSETYDG
jgi:hypothetical protein